MMSDFYQITVGSLPDYDDLIAEIYIDGRFVGLISQEQGPDKFLLEIPARDSEETMKVELALFEKAVAEAKSKLRVLRRI